MGGSSPRLAVASAYSLLHLTAFSGGNKTTFWEHSQVLERLSIQHTCGQDKSNLVCHQELKRGIEGHQKALTLLVAKRALVWSILPDLCSLGFMLPPLMRHILSVPPSPGHGWLDPVSEGFNTTKVMTLRRGKGEAPQLGSWPLNGLAKEPSFSRATQRGHAINYHMSRGSLRLPLLPITRLDNARSLHRIGSILGAFLSCPLCAGVGRVSLLGR